MPEVDRDSVATHLPPGYILLSPTPAVDNPRLYGFQCASIQVNDQTDHNVSIAWTAALVVPPTPSPNPVWTDFLRFETFLDPEQAPHVAAWMSTYGIPFIPATVTAGFDGVKVEAEGISYRFDVLVPTAPELFESPNWDRDHVVRGDGSMAFLERLVDESYAYPTDELSIGTFAGGVFSTFSHGGQSGTLAGLASSGLLEERMLISLASDPLGDHPGEPRIIGGGGDPLGAKFSGCRGVLALLEATQESLNEVLPPGYEARTNPPEELSFITELFAGSWGLHIAPTGKVHAKAAFCDEVTVDGHTLENVTLAWTGVLLGQANGAESETFDIDDEYLFELFVDPQAAPELAGWLHKHGIPYTAAQVLMAGPYSDASVVVDGSVVYELPASSGPYARFSSSGHRTHFGGQQPYWIDQSGREGIHSDARVQEVTVAGGVLGDLDFLTEAGPVALAMTRTFIAHTEWIPNGPLTD